MIVRPNLPCGAHPATRTIFSENLYPQLNHISFQIYQRDTRCSFIINYKPTVLIDLISTFT